MEQEAPDKSIFATIGTLYIVFGIVGCLVSLFPILPLAMFLERIPAGGIQDDQIPQLVRVFFVIFPVTVIFIGAAISVLMIMCGIKMRSFKSYGFIFFVAVLSLFSFPFGTALGILSLIYLQKPANRKLFGA